MNSSRRPKDEPLEIPEFLLRGPGNQVPDIDPPEVDHGFPDDHPASSRRDDSGGDAPSGVHAAPAATAEVAVPDTAAEFEQRRKNKSYTRLAKMRDKQAVKDGKTWDAQKAKWV